MSFRLEVEVVLNWCVTPHLMTTCHVAQTPFRLSLTLESNSRVTRLPLSAHVIAASPRSPHAHVTPRFHPMRSLWLVDWRAGKGAKVRRHTDDTVKSDCAVGQWRYCVWIEHCIIYGEQKAGTIDNDRLCQVGPSAPKCDSWKAELTTAGCSCKQVMTIALGVVLFDLHINFTNGIGIVLTLIGGVSLSQNLSLPSSSIQIPE